MAKNKKSTADLIGMSHFSRNGLDKQWVKNKYKEIIDE